MFGQAGIVEGSEWYHYDKNGAAAAHVRLETSWRLPEPVILQKYVLMRGEVNADVK